MHPFETVFLKSSWDVGQPHLDRYTHWLQEHAEVRAPYLQLVSVTMQLDLLLSAGIVE